MKLRAFQESDWPRAAEILTSREVAKTYMLPEFESAEAARPLFDRLLTLSRTGERYERAMEADGLFVGFLNDVEQRGTQIELGYVIHPDHKNQGYATEALAAAMQALFDLGLTAVVTGAFAENTASMRVMEKCGMLRTDFEEVIPYQGVDHRCVYYKKERPV